MTYAVFFDENDFRLYESKKLAFRYAEKVKGSVQVCIKVEKNGRRDCSLWFKKINKENKCK